MSPPHSSHQSLDGETVNGSQLSSQVRRNDVVDSEKGTPPAGPPNGPPPRKILFTHITLGVFQLLILFWFAASMMLGKMYKQNDYLYRLHIKAVDLDGGEIGDAMLKSTAMMNQMPHQPTWDLVGYGSGETYESVRKSVWEGNHVWGAIVANPNASDHFSVAISSADESFDTTKALTIIYNESRYRTVEQAYILNNLVTAASRTAATYQKIHGPRNVALIPQNSTSLGPMLDPIGYTIDNIQPFDFSASYLLNTVMFVFPVLSQFFCVLVLNGVLGTAGAYKNWSLRENLTIRFIASIIWPFFIGLSWAGWLFSYQNTANLNGEQFAASWFMMFLYAMTNFWVIDGVISQVEMRWSPLFILSWIMCQIEAVVAPLDLANNFFRVDYFFQSHHVWGVLMTVYGKGANNHLKINLTVSFMWLIVAMVWGVFGNVRRWRGLQNTKTE